MALPGQEGSFISKGCHVASCGAQNPVAALMARTIIDEMNRGSQSLAATQTNEVAQQNVGTRETGHENGRG